MSEHPIRAMAPHEAEEVAELFHRVWHETQGPLQDPRIARHRDIDFFRQRVAQRGERTLVVQAGGRIAGFSAWTGDCLNSLFIDSGFRGLGLGAALCRQTEIAIRDAGASRSWLSCIEGNWSARRFYEEQAWHCDRLVRLESQTPEGPCGVSAWRMIKVLGPA